ncbi:hypothetical protein ABMA27_003103 [Loxostege sticticalis]|uniref:CHK kinase-like domain-containing protein n=1 Tax=Loxostege sticticalis TaxID=481309 RepID=A0ABR3HRX9_LOXSC
MASLQFEGDTSGLSEKQELFIREVIEKQGFKDNKVLFEPVGKAGDNMIANMKRLTIATNGKEDIKMIAKIAPKHEPARTFMNASLLFNNERIMYEEVLPKFISLQASVDVPANERFMFAKCYGCLLEAPNEVIVLEDLKQKDYVMFDKLVPLGDDTVKATVKNFSILHSLSYALKHLEPETFENFKSSLFDIFSIMETTDIFRDMVTLTEMNTLEVLEDENHKKIIQSIIPQWLPIYKKLQKGVNSDKHLVIQHGDAWTNNILFKLEDGKIVSTMMIDYQLSKAASPVCDLLYMIFNCTDHITRSKHYHEWINYYHDELDKSLSNFGLKASLIYPKDQLDADLKRYSKQFFCNSVLFYSMLSRNEEEAALVKDTMKTDDILAMKSTMTMGNMSKDTIDGFRSKVVDLIDSYRELGYLA